MCPYRISRRKEENKWKSKQNSKILQIKMLQNDEKQQLSDLRSTRNPKQNTYPMALQ